MSGRFTFTAGNTLTAAQLNTNVMDGIPYKIQTGSVSISMTSASPWSKGSANVTGLTGFTQAPFIVSNVNSGTDAPFTTHIGSTSTSAFTLYCYYYGASATSRTVRWVAIQATPSDSAGS